MRPTNANAPGMRTEGEANKDQLGGGSIPTLPENLDAATVATIIDGAFIVVVEIDEDRRHRRAFFTLSAAEGYAGRATDRGRNATIILASLTPVCHVAGGDTR